MKLTANWYDTIKYTLEKQVIILIIRIITHFIQESITIDIQDWFVHFKTQVLYKNWPMQVYAWSNSLSDMLLTNKNEQSSLVYKQCNNNLS